jgi:hypothetical protein
VFHIQIKRTQQFAKKYPLCHICAPIRRRDVLAHINNTDGDNVPLTRLECRHKNLGVGFTSIKMLSQIASHSEIN